MPVDAWVTLVCVVIGVYYLVVKPLVRPKRYDAPPPSRMPVRTYSATHKPAQASKRYDAPPQKKEYPPFLPTLFALLAQTAGDIKQAWQKAVITWSNHPANMSRQNVTITVDTKKYEDGLAKIGTELGNGTGTELGTEAGTDDKLTISMGREIAIKKWHAGEKLTKTDLAALMGVRKKAAFEVIDSLAPTTPKEDKDGDGNRDDDHDGNYRAAIRASGGILLD